MNSHRTRMLPIVVVIANAASFVVAQPMSQPEQNKMMQNQMLLQQLQYVSHNELIQKELEIVDSQMDELKTIMNSYQKQQQKIIMDYQKDVMAAQEAVADGDQKKAMSIGKNIQNLMSQHTADTIKTVEEILLPHQMKRLRQIARRQSSRYRGGYPNDEFGAPMALAAELDLSDDEKQRLQEAIDQVRKDYNEKVDRWKKSAEKKIMDVLPPDKRKKYLDLVGEPFDYEAGMRSIGLKMQQKAKRAAQEAKAKLQAAKDGR